MRRCQCFQNMRKGIGPGCNPKPAGRIRIGKTMGRNQVSIGAAMLHECSFHQEAELKVEALAIPRGGCTEGGAFLPSRSRWLSIHVSCRQTMMLRSSEARRASAVAVSERGCRVWMTRKNGLPITQRRMSLWLSGMSFILTHDKKIGRYGTFCCGGSSFWLSGCGRPGMWEGLSHCFRVMFLQGSIIQACFTTYDSREESTAC